MARSKKTTEEKVSPIRQAQGKRVSKGKAAIRAEVFDTKGKVVETMSLPAEIFAASINPQLMAQAVRVYSANQRGGFAATKTRAEVAGSTRKIYRQKGTGRARHGAQRAPIFVHGGIAHGPKPQDYSLNLSKKMRKLALFSALTAKLRDGKIKFVCGLTSVSPKTKDMASVMETLALSEKKRKVLLVTHDDSENVTRSVRNLSGVAFTSAARLNTYEVLNNKVLLMMKESVDTLKTHFLKGEKA